MIKQTSNLTQYWFDLIIQPNLTRN